MTDKAYGLFVTLECFDITFILTLFEIHDHVFGCNSLLFFILMVVNYAEDDIVKTK